MTADIIGCGRNRILDMTYCEDCKESPETKGCTERRRRLGVPFIINWIRGEQSQHARENRTHQIPMSEENWIISDQVPHTYGCPVCKEEIVRDEPFFQYKLYGCPHCGNLISIGTDGILR